MLILYYSLLTNDFLTVALAALFLFLIYMYLLNPYMYHCTGLPIRAVTHNTSVTAEYMFDGPFMLRDKVTSLLGCEDQGYR